VLIVIKTMEEKMKFVKWFIILSVGMFLLMGCSDDDDSTGPDTTGAILVINEFLASNDFGAVDENGDHDDWIEIYNAGDEAIDIGGMYITDNLEELMTSQIPATDPTLTTIEPGDFLILWADKEPEQGILHIDDVKLSGDGEQIGLTDVDGTTILDSLTYGEQTTDISFGRVPDGEDTWEYFGYGYDSVPTPGTANGSGNVPVVICFINEFMASNDYGPVDENGEHDDWIEIYNPNDYDIDLAGSYITDEIGDSTMTTWQIPTGFVETVIPAQGFLVLWADKEPEQGPLHVNIKLSGGGEDIALTNSDGVTIIDQLTYDEQTTDISYGRIPDGEDTWDYFGVDYASMPSPGAVNGSVEPVVIFFINEFLASNDTCFADEHGDFDDWIEIYNAGNIAGDIGGMYFTDDLTELMNSQIPTTFPDSTTINPGEYLIIWADKEPEQGILHLDDVKLSGDGEDIGLTAADGTTIIDSYTFGAQTTDVSEGRMPDGGTTWQFFSVPTPGAMNE
jgi:hypothetical protein